MIVTDEMTSGICFQERGRRGRAGEETVKTDPSMISVEAHMGTSPGSLP